MGGSMGNPMNDLKMGIGAVLLSNGNPAGAPLLTSALGSQSGQGGNPLSSMMGQPQGQQQKPPQPVPTAKFSPQPPQPMPPVNPSIQPPQAPRGPMVQAADPRLQQLQALIGGTG